MVRDNEISRLVSYAEALGVKVLFCKKTDDADGQWALDGTEIKVFIDSSTSKTSIILTLIHEIGHSKHFIWRKNREPDLKFEEAIDRQNLVAENLDNKPIPKKFRKRIYDTELASTKFWLEIYHETGMKFPLWKLYMQMECDVWAYESLRDTGFFPKSKDWDLKRKELMIKYKNKTDFA